MRPRTVVFVVWSCFLLRALFYATVFPLWEGFDEYSQFAMIQYVSLHGDLPDPNTANSSRQVLESLKLAPVSRVIVNYATGLTTHDDYWRLPAAERQERERQLRSIPSTWATKAAQPRLALYEAQQAPLYYWLMAPVYLATRAFELPTQVWLLRCFGVLLASGVIPLAFVTARRVFESERMALGVIVIIASLPQVMISVFRIGNEGVSIAMGSVLILLAVWLSNSPPGIARGAIFGVAFGAALLTKAYFLALAPAGAMLLVWIVWRSRKQRRDAILQMAAALIVCLAVCGWWYWRAEALTGTISGQPYVAGVPVASAIFRIPWARLLDFLATSHIWIGNWSFIVVRAWMYRLVEVLMAVSATGVAWQLWAPKAGLPKMRPLALMGVPFVSFLLALCFHGAAGYLSSGGGSLGFYLYCLVVAEVILMLAGAAYFFPERWRLAPVPVFVFTFLVIEIFGTWFLLLPYYAGFIAHTAAGGLPALRLSQIGGNGVAMLFDHLRINKSAFLSPAGLGSVAALYFLASATLLWISVRELRPAEDSALRTAEQETPAPPD